MVGVVKWCNQMGRCLKRTHSAIVIVNLCHFAFVVGANYGPSLREFHLKTKALFQFRISLTENRNIYAINADLKTNWSCRQNMEGSWFVFFEPIRCPEAVYQE